LEVGLPSASLMRSHQSKKTASPFQQNNCVVWAADLIQDAYKKQMVLCSDSTKVETPDRKKISGEDSSSISCFIALPSGTLLLLEDVSCMFFPKVQSSHSEKPQGNKEGESLSYPMKFSLVLAVVPYEMTYVLFRSFSILLIKTQNNS